MMNISGLIQPRTYDPRATSSAALTRAIMAPQYSNISYTAVSVGSMSATQQHSRQPSLFAESSYGISGPNGVGSAFGSNYIQQRPQVRMVDAAADSISRTLSYPEATRQSGPVEDQHSLYIKAEPQALSGSGSAWSLNPNATFSNASPTIRGHPEETPFGTDVDTLMKAIQAKSQQSKSQPQPHSSIDQSTSVVGFSPPNSSSSMSMSNTHPLVAPVEKDNAQKLTSDGSQDNKTPAKKRYECSIKGCDKSFYQKTHLEIHTRAHSGVKPYVCKAHGCNQRFSQRGNLKTHERRHTGERPYQCEQCGKRFAQRGNVRAHRIVHDRSKPFVCRLEECGKQFTQLGNLKSHMNKFHARALHILTAKFASGYTGEPVSAADRELREYFATLYKNANKGIKGRGKDVRVVGSASTYTHASVMSMLGTRGGMGSIGVLGSNLSMGLSPNGVMTGHQMKIEGRDVGHMRAGYAIFEDDGTMSRSGSHSSESSSASVYGIDPSSDVYETDERNLAFGDRIY